MLWWKWHRGRGEAEGRGKIVVKAIVLPVEEKAQLLIMNLWQEPSSIL